MIKIKKYQIEDYISDATQDALDLKADLVNGKVPASQLPSFVDDVIEVANYAALPIPGATGVIYITLDTNKVYRWTGSVYVEIASGVTNLSYTPGVSDGTVNSDTGTDATIPLAGVTNAGLFSAAEKTKLAGIATGANVGVVPNAPITGATKTKITYDSKGLVTAGVDATTADIADSTNKRYVTDANLVVIGNTSGTNTGDQDLQEVTNLGATTTNPIIVTALGDDAITAYAGSGTAITGNAPDGTGIYGTSINGDGVVGYSETAPAASFIGIDKGIKVTAGNTFVVELNQGLTSKGLVINSGTSSTGNFIELDKNGVDKLTVNQQGTLAINTINANGLNINTSGADSSKLAMAITSTISDGTAFACYSYGGSVANYIYSDSGDCVVLQADYPYGLGLNISSAGGGLSAYSIAYPVAELYQALDNKGLVINSGTSSTGNFIELNKNGIDKFTINQQGEQSIVKIPGGLPTEYLMADGSVSTGGGGGGIPHATASGTDTYTATVTGVTSYADGDAYLIRFPIGNTTVATLNINALGAIPLYRNNDGPLIGGDVQANGEMLCVYNSTANTFQCIGTSPNSIISYVTNADSITITKGQVVYAFGGTGDRMTVKLASNIGDSTSAQTVGIVLSTSIAANQKGFIIFQGLLDNLSILPTATWADGDPVYLGTTAGSITKIKPYAPNHLVYIGIVTTASNGTAGRMYVRVQNGYELDELHNVQAQTPTLKDTLYYDNTVSPAQWKTASISSILGYIPANNANVVHLTGDETIAGAKTFTDNLTAGRYLYSGGSIFPEFGQTFYINGIGATHYFGGGTSNAQNNLEVSNGTLKIGLQTASTIASFDANKNVVSLTTANGYPTLTELKSLVGVSTTAIQTQLNGKQASSSILSGLSALSFSGGTPFVRMISGSVFTLDTATYLTSVGIANLTATGTPSATTYLRGDNTWSSIPVPSQSAYTVLANNTNASAVPTEQVYKDVGQQTYTATPTWSGTAPTTILANTYEWSQIGSTVNVRISLSYNTGQSSTSVILPMPADMPAPASITGFTGALDVLSYGSGMMLNATTSTAVTGARNCLLRRNAANTGYEFFVNVSIAVTTKVVIVNLTYFA